MAGQDHARFAKHELHERCYQQLVRDAWNGREIRIDRGKGRRSELVPLIRFSDSELWVMGREKSEELARKFARKEAA